MMKYISAANKGLDALVKYLAYLAAVLLVLMAFCISLDVVIRYVANYSFKWVFEGTEYSLLFVTFFAATWVLQQEGHVRLDLVLNALGKKLGAWINVLTSLVMGGVCLVITLYSAKYTLYLYQNDITIIKYYTVPQFIFFIVIPIGFFLLFIQSLKRAYAFLRQIQEMRA